MNSENDEPPTKIRKRDESRSICCSALLRKMTGNHKKVERREDVYELYKDYGKIFILGDIICFKCRAKFRKEKSSANAPKNLHESESSQVSSSNQTEELEDSQMEDLSLADVVESPPQQDFSDEESFIESSQQRLAHPFIFSTKYHLKQFKWLLQELLILMRTAFCVNLGKILEVSH